MAYEKQEWKDGEDGGTPITAERLNNMEQGIVEKAAQGPKGDPGENGEDGKNGTDGKDGFPTEEQWEDLVSRVEKLENDEEGEV